MESGESEEPEGLGLKPYQDNFCGACGVLVSDEEYLEDYTPHLESQQIGHPYIELLFGTVAILLLVSIRIVCLDVPLRKDQIVTERYHLFGNDGTFRDERITIYPANFFNRAHRHLYPHGFPIHDFCWTMIERAIGQSAEKELDLFLEDLHEIWTRETHPFEVSNCINDQTWTGIDGKEYPPEELHAVWDPEDIPEIHGILRRCTLPKVKKRSSTSRNPGTLEIPLDILIQILDYLHTRDTENLLTATQWQLPDFYWRSRFPRKLIFEADELISAEPENINWQFLCLEIEKLVDNESLHGLQNRKRIFRVLEGTKELFLSRMSN